MVVRSGQVSQLYSAMTGNLLLTCSSNASLEPLVPYFSNGSLQVEALMPGLRQEHIQAAFTALKQLASQTKMQNLIDSIATMEGKEKERQERLARDVIPQLRPIKAVSRVVSPLVRRS